MKALLLALAVSLLPGVEVIASSVIAGIELAPRLDNMELQGAGLLKKGLEYRYDEEMIITIPGDDFANAYFSIWIGEHPSSQTIKDAMLGDKSNG